MDSRIDHQLLQSSKSQTNKFTAGTHVLYRPVSNLSFVSKLVERAAVKQLTDYLETNGLLPLLQSAYRSHHSTETALLKVLSDVLTAIDNKVTLLALLDLSAAFDCVDHDILLSRLQSRFGLDGAALAWIRSFLSDRTQRVCFGGRLSAEIALIFGVPQGSVLGPLLFLLYTAELFDIISSLGLTGHSYADDTQVYISAPVVESQQPQPVWPNVSSDLIVGWGRTV